MGLHTGEALTILAQLTLNEVVPAGAKVSLDIRKEGIPELPIPCLEITNEEGELLHIAHVNTLLITFSTDTLTFCAQITFQRVRPVPPLLTQELMEENHQLRSSSPKFPTSWLT